VISLISNIYNYFNYYISNCVLTLIFALYHNLELMDSSARISSLKRSSGAGLALPDPLFAWCAYWLEIMPAWSRHDNLQSISVLRLNKVWPLKIITINFTRDFIPYFKIFDTFSREYRVAGCKVHIAKIFELTLLVCKNLLDFTENLHTMDWFLISAQARDFSLWSWFCDFKFDFSDFGQGVRDFTECWTPRPSRLPCQGTCWTL